LRWIDEIGLEGLEKLVLRSPVLQALVLHCHKRALTTLLPAYRGARTVLVVGGALFPRTAVILAELLPDAEITIVDCSLEHIRRAMPLLPARVKVAHGLFEWSQLGQADLTVVPLSFRGPRPRFSPDTPPSRLPGHARWVLMHDWLWRRCGQSVVVSFTLLKRINLITT
jgi:hypothetical protein